MEFKKYQHIVMHDSAEAFGFRDGTCHVFPKIDGTNSSVWNHEGTMCIGSKFAEVNEHDDTRGLYRYCKSHVGLNQFIRDYPEFRLYGEWLVPHTLRTYQDDAWEHFYVFDVRNEQGKYIPYETYKHFLETYHIKFIPRIGIVEDGYSNNLNTYVQSNTYLQVDGCIGEGIIIKNYDFINKFGRVVWVKMLNISLSRRKITYPQFVQGIEEKIAFDSVTTHMVTKVHYRMEVAHGKALTDQIYQARLNSAVYHEIFVEELWDHIQKHKLPIIDFKKLQKAVQNRIVAILAIVKLH